MRESAQKRLWFAGVFVTGLLIGLLCAGPFLPRAVQHGLRWPIRLAGEGPSLTTYGKWWIHPPHRYLADGFSGEFPTFYNYLSDALLNLLATPFDWAPITVQAVLYGPLLAALFFWVNFASVQAVSRDRWVALLASLVLSLGASSGVPRLLPGVNADALDVTLHVPFHALSLGTAQSLGWVLFLPSLALLHLAREGFTRTRAIGFGICTGLLFHVHTLTFLNVAFAQLACLTMANAVDLEPRKRRLWAAGLGLIVLAFAARAALGSPLTSGVLIAFGGGALLVNLTVDGRRRSVLWGYGAAALVIAPYALALLRDLAGVSRISEQGNSNAVSPPVLLAYFAPLVVAGGLGLLRAPDRRLRLFLAALLGATFFLAVNHLWNWGNHPYRFAIHLIFPLALLAALGVRHAPRWLAAPLALWILGGLGLNVAGFLRGPRLYANAPAILEVNATFLMSIADATAGFPGDGRVLTAPEHVYPLGLTQSALIFNYSRLPGFIPDYRYLLARERYFNRLGLFCFLFPGYRAVDLHLDRMACEEDLAPPARLVALKDPRLQAAILPVYRIDLAAAAGNPFGDLLAERQKLYGWATVLEGGERRRFVRTSAPPLPGLATFVRGADDSRIGFRTEVAGPHVVVLGGRGLGLRAPHILVDGKEARGPREGNWAVLRTELDPGEHRLEMPPPGVDRDGERDVLYFAAVVHERWAGEYLVLPGGDGGGP